MMMIHGTAEDESSDFAGADVALLATGATVVGATSVETAFAGTVVGMATAGVGIAGIAVESSQRPSIVPGYPRARPVDETRTANGPDGPTSPVVGAGLTAVTGQSLLTAAFASEVNAFDVLVMRVVQSELC